MTITGYSDRINHALAFAAKHHDQQVRKGTRLPYVTHPANVAIILTRYGCDEQTVVAGVLHDVIEDHVREGYTADMLDQRVADKFGRDVLDTVLMVTHRRLDDAGVELSYDERRDDFLDRLATATDAARWVCAADRLHDASSLLADLRRTIDPNTIWSRFTGGKAATIRDYRRIYARLVEVGFDGDIMRELGVVVAGFDAWVGDPAPQTA
ncbi:MAG: HD domain-containing protein [Gemmatimonadaceae bacterium]